MRILPISLSTLTVVLIYLQFGNAHFHHHHGKHKQRLENALFNSVVGKLSKFSYLPNYDHYQAHSSQLSSQQYAPIRPHYHSNFRVRRPVGHRLRHAFRRLPSNSLHRVILPERKNFQVVAHANENLQQLEKKLQLQVGLPPLQLILHVGTERSPNVAKHPSTSDHKEPEPVKTNSFSQLTGPFHQLFYSTQKTAAGVYDVTEQSLPLLPSSADLEDTHESTPDNEENLETEYDDDEHSTDLVVENQGAVNNFNENVVSSPKPPKTLLTDIENDNLRPELSNNDDTQDSEIGDINLQEDIKEEETEDDLPVTDPKDLESMINSSVEQVRNVLESFQESLPNTSPLPDSEISQIVDTLAEESKEDTETPNSPDMLQEYDDGDELNLDVRNWPAFDSYGDLEDEEEEEDGEEVYMKDDPSQRIKSRFVKDPHDPKLEPLVPVIVKDLKAGTMSSSDQKVLSQLFGERWGAILQLAGRNSVSEDKEHVRRKRDVEYIDLIHDYLAAGAAEEDMYDIDEGDYQDAPAFSELIDTADAHNHWRRHKDPHLLPKETHRLTWVS